VQARLADSGFEEIQEAQANLERIQEVRPVDVVVATTEVERATAAMERATAELEQSYVRSPLSGQVLEVHTQAGEVVGPQGVVSMGRTDAMYVIAEVYEADVGRLAIGRTAYIVSEYGGFSGELRGTLKKLVYKLVATACSILIPRLAMMCELSKLRFA
jgi:HlyD family secretion protein